jgi:hypothetical protein
MSLGYWETLATLKADGTALTAAARASLTQGAAATGARYTLPGGKLRVGDVLDITASGRISCAVTTPGTARFDLSFGGTANFDSLAIPLNIVAKTNVPWILNVWGTVREIGTTGNIFWQGFWLSEAGLNVAVPSTGPGPGGNTLPYNTAPVVGPNIDLTVSQLIDLQFTQTVATGSCTLHQYCLSLRSSSGF